MSRALLGKRQEKQKYFIEKSGETFFVLGGLEAFFFLSGFYMLDRARKSPGEWDGDGGRACK